MRIGLVSIFVDDQDRAEQFYTQVLDLQVKTNAPYGPDERWLTVVSPEEPDGVELVLHRTDEPARAFQAASREQGRPVLSLRTDDCAADAERLKAKGVVFVKEPYRRDYGGIDAVFADSCGNLLNLHRTEEERCPDRATPGPCTSSPGWRRRCRWSTTWTTSSATTRSAGR
jgi:catechol 2,3-dioxygenase-like lactoylglutathione lyase family enzyme